jgi:uncharacterized RDD family membrane protein YckC/ribosomal protein L40E
VYRESRAYDRDQQYCMRCGAPLEPGAVYCGRCGAPASGSPTRPLDLPEPDFPSREHMGFWVRFAAYLIDSLLVLVLVALLSRIFGVGGIFIAYLFSLLYYVLLTTMQGQTLGKMVVGIQVVDARGYIPSLGTVLLREVVGKFISGLFFNLGYLWVGWDRDKRGWHDHIAGTYVVRKERML